ncbi:MAG: efflux family protein [Myxococcaceae bacterium]|nr:efflux family protein [Myxococcaceae bacterium]
MDPTWRPPTVRELFALAWPMILGRAAQSVVGFTDAVLVAPLGPDALAATGNGALNAFAVFMLPLGVAFIVQSFAAQLAASPDRARLRRFGWYGLGIAGLAQLVAVALVPAVPWLLARADYTPAVRALMGDYIALRLLGVGGAVGIEALANWFGGQGNTRVGLAASVLVMALNVPLAWLLIHGGHGLPAMGVRGAAIASIIATGAGFAYVLVTFLRAGRGVPAPGWRWGEFRRVLRFGLPNGVNWFLEFAAFLFFIDVVFARMGTAALAALMAVLQLNSVAFMPAFGLANAGAIHVGQAIGAGHPDAVRALVRRTMLVAAGWMALVGAGYALTPRLLLAPFSPGSLAERTGFLAVGVPLLWVAVAWQLFDAATMVLSETLRAAGDTAWPMRMRIAISWGAFVPITLLTARWGGGPVVALSWVVLYMAALSALLARRFAGGAWRTMSLTGDEPALVVD